MVSQQASQQQPWQEFEQWWVGMARWLGVAERAQLFFKNSLGQNSVLERVAQLGGDVHYIVFVLLRYWSPAVLPPTGRERLSKNDPDYWLETEQILKSAVVRLREIKPLIDLLTTSNPMAPGSPAESLQSKPVGEAELAHRLESLADAVGSYGGPDYTSVIKNFDPIPLRQTQPFKHNKKNSAELWVVFLLREHIHGLGLGKHRCWPFIADLMSAAGINQSSGLPYTADELKAWWHKNWPRTYAQLEHPSTETEPTGAAYQHDFEWFRSWFAWQTSHSR